jgi:hypothetical protein
MIEPAFYLFMALLGSIAGLLAERFRASGLVALILPVIPGPALWAAIGRSWHDPLLMLMESILCFASPLAVLYAFHAKRKAPQRALAWIGLILCLVVFIPFAMATMGAVRDLKDALCHWNRKAT